MQVLVFKFGLLPPTSGREAVLLQMRQAHRYQNELLAALRSKRIALREVEPHELVEMRAEVAALEEQVREYSKRMRDVRQLVGRAPGRGASEEERRNWAEGAHARREFRELRKRAKEARARLKARRAELLPGLKQTWKSIHETWVTARRTLRQQYSQRGKGLRHGTYLAVEEAVRASGRMPLWDGAKPQDPSFRRWKGEGTVGVQIQRGCPVNTLLACTHTFAQLDRTPNPSVGAGGKRDPKRPLPRRAATWGVLRLRIGTDFEHDRAPIWAEWPIIYHRPLPACGTVKRINVHRRLFGPRERWHCTVTVEVPDDWKTEQCGSGAVAVRVGWSEEGVTNVRLRKRDGTFEGVSVPILTVARWVGEDGGSGSLQVPPRAIVRLQRSEHLRSTRDKLQDQMRTDLLAQLKALPTYPEALPPLSHLALWRSPSRWAALARQWEQQQPSGNEAAALGLLQAWAAKDRHLWEWERFEERRGLGHRLDAYRKLGAQLARRYRTLVLRRVDWGRAARVPLNQNLKASLDSNVEDMDYRPPKVRTNRELASPGKLELSLIGAFERRGGSVVLLDVDGETTAEALLAGYLSQPPTDATAKEMSRKKRKDWRTGEHRAEEESRTARRAEASVAE